MGLLRQTPSPPVSHRFGMGSWKVLSMVDRMAVGLSFPFTLITQELCGVGGISNSSLGGRQS